MNDPRGTGTEIVTFAFPRPDQFEIVISGAEQLPQRLSFSRKPGDYKCDGSTLIINTSPAKWEGGSAMGGFGVVGASVMMKFDLVEGCLIVTKRDKDFMLLPIPGWSTWSSWYRFCAVSPDVAMAPDK